MIYVLVVVAMIMAGNAGGGASITVTTLKFTSQEACGNVALELTRTGSIWETRFAKGGMYKIDAFCVRDK